MTFRRVRFTLRRMMVAVAVVALVLKLELFFFHYAVEDVRSGDPEYIWGEAVIVWVFLNVAISIPIGVVARIVGAVLRERSVAKNRDSHGRSLVGPDRRDWDDAETGTSELEA